VYEDPATGAATAALAGYLREIDWPHGGKIEVIQGEDMGSRSAASRNSAGKRQLNSCGGHRADDHGLNLVPMCPEGTHRGSDCPSALVEKSK
jgi:hypothetical protein